MAGRGIFTNNTRAAGAVFCSWPMSAKGRNYYYHYCSYCRPVPLSSSPPPPPPPRKVIVRPSHECAAVCCKPVSHARAGHGQRAHPPHKIALDRLRNEFIIILYRFNFPHPFRVRALRIHSYLISGRRKNVHVRTYNSCIKIYSSPVYTNHKIQTQRVCFTRLNVMVL